MIYEIVVVEKRIESIFSFYVYYKILLFLYLLVSIKIFGFKVNKMHMSIHMNILLFKVGFIRYKDDTEIWCSFQEKERQIRLHKMIKIICITHVQDIH